LEIVTTSDDDNVLETILAEDLDELRHQSTVSGGE